MDEVEQIRAALRIGRANLPLFAADARKVARANEGLSTITDAEAVLASLAARLSAVEAERDAIKAAFFKLNELHRVAEAERDAARRDLATVQDAGHEIFERLGNQERRAEAAEARVEAIEQALRFYAKGDNWIKQDHDYATDWILDCPATVEGPWWLARAALFALPAPEPRNG